MMLLFFLGLAGLLVSFVGIFSRPYWLVSVVAGSVCLVVALLAIVIEGTARDREARSLGFASWSDRREAERAGVSSENIGDARKSVTAVPVGILPSAPEPNETVDSALPSERPVDLPAPASVTPVLAPAGTANGLLHSSPPANALAEQYARHGKDLLANRKYADARNAFTEAIRLDPANADFYGWRGHTFYSWGEVELALKDYDDAIRRDPKTAWFFWFHGIARQTKRDFYGAASDLEIAMRLDPTNAKIRSDFYRLKNEISALKERDLIMSAGCPYAEQAVRSVLSVPLLTVFAGCLKYDYRMAEPPDQFFISGSFIGMTGSGVQRRAEFLVQFDRAWDLTGAEFRVGRITVSRPELLRPPI